MQMFLNGEVTDLTAKKRMKLREALEKENIFLPVPCGGNGRCGKCAVRFLKGAPKISREDQAHFSQEELKNGWRLGCRAEIFGTCRVLVPKQREEMKILTTFGTRRKEEGRGENSEAFSDKRTVSASGERRGCGKAFKEASVWGDLGIGVDIGTTTIAMALIDLRTGETRKTYAGANSQRIFGADVLSRIQRANEGKREELCGIIRKDLARGVEELLKEERCNAALDEVAENADRLRQTQDISVAVAGNTTMLHLLLGYSCKTLGTAPFMPVDLSLVEAEVCRLNRNMRVTVFPGISAFVGADIVSGLYALRMLEEKQPVLLLDLGTNGEMALWTGKELYVTSAAAGPAFEGGNVKNGMPGIPGAICRVFADSKRIRVETIGNAAPAGICGTGVISAVCALQRIGALDAFGTLREPYLEDGFPLWIQSQRSQIRLYQEDIREIQMAKAAIRAGMELLLQEAGVAWENLKRLYLAGGMGYTLKPEDAADIGLIPSGMKGRCEAVGNASLGGTVRYLRKQDGEQLEKIAKKAKTLTLADHPGFEEKYLEFMNLG